MREGKWEEMKEEKEGGKWGKAKNAKTGNKINILLKLYKLQINAAKDTYDQTSSDKTPLKYILKSILNKENNLWNTNELLHAYWNNGDTESNSIR